MVSIFKAAATVKARCAVENIGITELHTRSVEFTHQQKLFFILKNTLKFT